MDIEARILEQRTNEAVQKNYMGMEGKIYRIAKYLGFEIIKDSGFSETIDYDEMFDITDPNTIPILDEGPVSYNIGYSYDGLSSGRNIEIVSNDYEQTIKLYCKGYLVYHEEHGTLMAFVPHDMWEKTVDDLYEKVQEKIKRKMEEIKKEEEQVVAELAQHELQKLRSKWGDIV